MADEVWLDVLPSMGGFGASLVKGTTKAAKNAGAKSGKEFSGAFENGAGGAADAAVKDLDVASKKSAALVSKLSGQVAESRRTQQRSAADLLNAEQRLTDATSKYGTESNQAQAATLRLEAARSKAEDATRKFDTAENGLREAQKAHKTVTEQLTAAQNDLGKEVKEAPGLWGKLSDSLGTAGGKVKEFAKGAGGLATSIAGAVGGAALLTEAFGASLETETVVDKLNASLAATPAQAETYGAAAGNLYSQAYGESMTDVGAAVDAVVSSMGGMRDASQADIEKITANAMDLATAFDVDVSEAAATAGSLMKNGLAADGVAAMDLIAGAMTKVPAAARGEILPVMDEYGKHFAALGLDGETAMGIIVASSADGAIGMDKMGDALKEFTIRGTDMSKSTVGAYESMGLSAKDMTNDLLAGGDNAEGAMAKIVHGLQGITDPGQQAAAAISLFGTPLEDLGTDQIPAFLGMVDPMGDAFDSTAGSADALSTTLNDNTATSLETLKRSFEGMLTDGIAPVLGPLQSVMDWATNTPGVMTAVAVALGIVALGWAAVTLAASPWLLVGVGIALVVAGIILVVKNMGGWIDWLRTNALEPFLNWISPAWAALGVGFTAIYQNVLKPVFDGLGAAANWLWKNVLQPVFGWMGEAWANWSGHARTVWDTVLKPVFDAVGAGAKWLYDNTLKPVFGWISDRWNGMTSGVKSGWDKTMKPAWDAVSAGATWLYEYGIKPALGWIGDKWSALTKGIGTAWNQYGKPIFGAISDLLKGDFVGAWDHAKTAVARIWGGIQDVAKKPISFVINTVINKGLIGAFNKVTGWIPGMKKLSEVKIPGFAEGGYTGPGHWLKPAGEVHAGEFVLRQKATNKLRSRIGLAGLEHMNQTGEMPGYAGGGLVHPMAPGNRGVSAGWHGYPGHKGTDYPAPVGTPVYSPGAGTVAQVGTNLPGGTGKQVWINHDNGLLSRVHHLSQWLVQAGQRVGAGQAIGRVGMTGNTTGPHAHWGVMDGSRYLNPASIWGSGAGGSGDFYGGGGGFDPMTAFSGLAEKLAQQFSSQFPGGGQLVDMAKGIGGKLIGDVKQWATDKLSAVGDFASDVVRNISGNSPKQQVRGVAEHYGWNKGNQWSSLNELIRRESGWDPNAANPRSSARGLFQKMTSIHGPIEATADGQAKWGLNYIKERYGNPQNAIDFHDRRGHYAEGGFVGASLYDKGGVLEPGFTPVLNKTRQPEYVFTTPQWSILERVVNRQITDDQGGTYNITISVKELEGIKTLEEFLTMARRKARQKVGS